MTCSCGGHRPRLPEMNGRQTRREFITTSAGGVLGFLLGQGLLPAYSGLWAQDGRTQTQRSAGKSSPARAKHIIVLWMGGGPSQLDTWDPKPGSKNQGEFKPIETRVRGIQISETLPKMAQVMDKVSIIRGMWTGEFEHFRATYLLHTGQKFRESFPFPAAGSMISYETSESLELPGYVTIGMKGFGPTFLGYEHAPFVIDNPGQALQMLREVASKKRALDLSDQLEQEFNDAHECNNTRKRDVFYDRITKILDSPFSKALDLSKEPEQLRNEYGRNGFGEGCLLARRLVEIGTRFVEVHLGGWDTHENNFDAVRQRCSVLDPAMATLIKDLDQKGLLKETIVLWMGEFGRTPEVNDKKGRDHWANGFSVVIGGGGLAGGRVIGETDKDGMSVLRGMVKPADLMATIFKQFGMDPNKKYYSPQGSLVKATDGGTIIKELL